jgi:hypothetical protein
MDEGVRFPAGAWNFSICHRVQTGSGAYPASYLMNTGDLSPEVRRPGREANHSPPSSALLTYLLHGAGYYLKS